MEDASVASMTYADVEAAEQRCRSRLRTTPLVHTTPGDFGLDFSVALKLESLQHAGSFKARGSLNSALATDLPDAGLIAASGGNHGIAVARTASVLGVAAEVFVPTCSAPAKVERIRHYGASVTVTGALYDDAQAACVARQKDTGAFEIHPYNTPLTIAGQGTLGVELATQLSDVDTVLIAVGGGGLIAGVRLALPNARIVGVETHECNALHAAQAANAPSPVSPSGVAKDALGARMLGTLPWQILRDRVDSVLVDDDVVLDTQRAIWRQFQLAVEPAAAVALAALRSGSYVPSPGEYVAVVVCGGNVDPGSVEPAA